MAAAGRPARGAIRFFALTRAFVAQFAAAESIASEAQLRRSVAGLLAFLFTPGILLLFEIFPSYQYAVVRAQAGRQPFSTVEDLLAWMAFLFTTYSMVTVGLIAVLVWDRLGFDRRDALILGPLPIGAREIIAAKLCALGALLLAASTAVNLLNAVVFAIETSDRLGAAAFARHFAAHFVATSGAAAFVFASIVIARGLFGMIAGPRAIALAGSAFQFVFVIVLLLFVVLSPSVRHDLPFMTNDVTHWMPTAWFVGLFERLRGSTRTLFDPLVVRAVVGTGVALVGAVLVSIVAVQRQFRVALTSCAAGGVGGARISRTAARLTIGRDDVARAIADFILITIARNRAQQAPIAITIAIGLALVVLELTRHATNLQSLVRADPSFLGVPIVLAYWAVVGMRASFLVPSELPAAWMFHLDAPAATRACRAAVRASVAAFVGPPATLLALGVGLAVWPWPIALRHAVFVAAQVVALASLVALVVDDVPFTRPYQPGHARLKTRWPLYALGSYGLGSGLCSVELSLLDRPVAFASALATIVLVIAAAEALAARRERVGTFGDRELNGAEESTLTVLDLGCVGSGNGGLMLRPATGGYSARD